MRRSAARNRRIVIIVVIALLIVAAEAAALYKMVSMIARGESPRQIRAQDAAGPLDLTGEWVQTNSLSKDSYQAIRITDQAIDVYWISESEGIYMLYWSGTCQTPAARKDACRWTSENDLARTSTSRRGSQAKEKEFRYADGKLTYQVEEGDQPETVEAERRTWSGGAEAVSAPADDIPQGEQLSGAGDIGDYHIAIGGLETVRDAEGYPAVIVTYTWTNNSEATASAMVMLLERAYQGERRREAAQLGQRAGYDAHSAARNVQPGGSATVQRAYRLAEEGGTVTYTVSEFLSHTKNAVVKEFDLDGPGR